jgi:hypothetical protein
MGRSYSRLKEREHTRPAQTVRCTIEIPVRAASPVCAAQSAGWTTLGRFGASSCGIFATRFAYTGLRAVAGEPLGIAIQNPGSISSGC